MATQTLQFGDKSSADIKLHVISSSGVEYGGNPLFVHSQVLKKGEVFETKLSERRSSTKRPFEMKVITSYSGEDYNKCIQLMYSSHTKERFYFSSVDEALSMLLVASEVMFNDCIEACMRYLNVVPWSRAQEAGLRVLLSSLDINMLPDLAVRLGMSECKSDCGDIEMLKDSLHELFSMTSNGSEYRSRVEKDMLDYFEANVSLAVKDACRSALLKEFNANVQLIKSESQQETACSTLSWVVSLIQRCDGKLFQTVLEMFCQDADLRYALSRRVNNRSSACDMLSILINQFLKAMGEGEVITTIEFRVSFLTNWLSTMLKFMATIKKYSGFSNSEFITFVNALERGMIEVGDALPLVEQRRIYNIWKDSFTKNSLNTMNAFNWWSDKLHDAVVIHRIF